MAKFRRGVNCVTPEFYAEVKPKLKSPADHKKVMREYKIGDSTCRSIRNTNSYEEYRARVADKRKNTRKLESIVENAVYDRAPEPEITVVADVDDEKKPGVAARIVGVFLVICLMLIAAGVTYATLKWAFGF